VPDQERIVDVTLDYIRLWLVRGVRPLRNLVDPTEQKNALALTATDGFHYPYQFLISASLEFLKENGIFTGQVVSEGEIIVPRCLFCLPLAF
jgi:hypothetical protein